MAIGLKHLPAGFVVPAQPAKASKPPVGTLLIERLAEDGATVFADACGLGAEGIVSKRVDGADRSDLWRVCIKVLNPASIAVQQERSEIWRPQRRNHAR
jgi:hypothetical protein